PISSSAASPPSEEASKYGFPRFFGRKVTETSPPSPAPLPPSPPSFPLSEPPEQAASARAVAAVMAARLLTRFLIRMVVSFRYVVVFCDRLLVSLAVRAFTHAARLVDTTDATSNRPVMMLMTSEVTFARRRALARTPMRRTPGITP